MIVYADSFCEDIISVWEDPADNNEFSRSILIKDKHERRYKPKRTSVSIQE